MAGAGWLPERSAMQARKAFFREVKTLVREKGAPRLRRKSRGSIYRDTRRTREAKSGLKK